MIFKFRWNCADDYNYIIKHIQIKIESYETYIEDISQMT